MPANADQLIKRLSALESQRYNIDDNIRDCYRYTYPARGATFEQAGSVSLDNGTIAASTAKTNKPDLLTSVGTDGVRIMASAIMSGATPANTIWFELDVPGSDDAAKKWLEESAKILWQNIHGSNYDSIGYEAILDMCISGQPILMLDEAPEGGLRFSQWDLANSYISSSRQGEPVDTVFNRYAYTAEQAINEYGENNVSEKVRQASREKPDTQFEFVRCIYPRGTNGVMNKNMPIASVHLERQSKKIVRETGYHEMPLIVPRWSLIPGSNYSLGPVFEALPDLKTLNTVMMDILTNLDLANAGMWIVQNDGVINTKNIKIGPRKVIVANSVDSMKPLAPAAKFDASFIQMEKLERQIRRMLMSDQLAPNDEGPQKTAYEISVRVEMIRQLLGPVYGRFQTEFLQPLVKRGFALAYRAGVFGPAPPSIQNKILQVKYIGPLARAQRMIEVQAMDRYENTLATEAAATGNTSILDNYDWDEAARERHALLGVPLKLLVDKDERDAARKAKADQQAAQQQMAMVAQIAQNQGG